MKLSSRIFAVAAAVVIAAASLSGCSLGKKLTAFGLYSRAASKIANAGGFETDCDITFGMRDLEIASVTMKMNLKQNGSDSQYTLMQNGSPVSTTTVIDRELYTDTAGVKLKYTLPEDAVSKNVSEISALPKLAEEVFDSVDVIEDESGGKSVTVNITGETAGQLLGDLTGSGFESLSFESADVTMNFNGENDLEGMTVTAKANVTVLGFTLGADMTADYRFLNFGEAPKIGPPEDAEDYLDMGEYKSGEDSEG